MIIYFSATGNSEHVASVIGAQTGDHLLSVERCMKDETFHLSAEPGESIGLIAPVYAFGLPSILPEFFRKAIFTAEKGTYTYFVATYGLFTGSSGNMANRLFQGQGMPLAARFSVKMPDTWTPMFDVSDQGRMQKKNRDAESELSQVVRLIRQEKHGDFMQGRLPAVLADSYYRLGYEAMRRTTHFHVEDSCTGCGRCARLCPGEAIQIRSQRPVWIKERCIMCLRCLHRCPEFAIQYGNHTKKHGQYIHPSIKG